MSNQKTTSNPSSISHDLHDVRDKASQTGEAIAKAAGHLADYAKDAAKETYQTASTRVSDSYHNAAERAGVIYSKVKEKGDETYQSAVDKAFDVEETVVKYVRKNPLKTVGFSLLAGFLLSKLFKD